MTITGLPFAFIFGLIGMAVAVFNPGHIFNNGKGTFGCHRSQHLGYQTKGWRGGQWERPRCVKDGLVVWCDQVCHR